MVALVGQVLGAKNAGEGRGVENFSLPFVAEE